MSGANSSPSQEVIEIAAFSQECYYPKDRFLDIDIGVFDYVLKCIDGPFQGKFFYINTSPLGEILGGSSDYDLANNPDKLTMYIENAELSKVSPSLLTFL
jgi:hypothetical protein